MPFYGAFDAKGFDMRASLRLHRLPHHKNAKADEKKEKEVIHSCAPP